ncbi:hypothetical protein N7G274_000650 [Stereocaulon virgatum]|uniref:Uncharacterized protein n=1 Tax=Stereocaulon virgatum TaxID=373712 RepID=A0ABR4APE8_9LECA
MKTQIGQHRTLLQNSNGHQRTFLTASNPQKPTVSESSRGIYAALQSLATKMDESLRLNDENWVKIDEQAAIVRKIEADVASFEMKLYPDVEYSCQHSSCGYLDSNCSNRFWTCVTDS